VARAPLATVADLSAYTTVPSDKVDLADRLLASVSAAVREAAESTITRETSTITLWTEASRRIELPGGPVRSVDSVTLDGAPVTDWVLRGSSLWREAPWQRYGDMPHELVVTYDHGLDEAPEDVVQLVCMLVSAGLAVDGEFGEDRGLASERIDDWQRSLTQGDAEIIDPTELPARTRDMLRDRFGGGRVRVVGTIR